MVSMSAEHLGRVPLVGQAVPHRDARVRGRASSTSSCAEPRNSIAVVQPAEHPRGVLDRLLVARSASRTGRGTVTCAPWSNAATSKAHRVRVDVFSKISAMFLPVSRGCSVPVALGRLELGREVEQGPELVAGVKSSSLRKFRPSRWRSRAALLRASGGVSLDRAGHAPGSAAAAAELAAGDRDDLDAVARAGSCWSWCCARSRR